MAGVALDGSTIAPSTKVGHVTYTQLVYNPQHHQSCTTNSEGQETCHWVDGYDSYNRTANATVEGKLKGVSHVKVKGLSVATSADQTQESWISDQLDPIATNISPSLGDPGTGSVNNSGSHVKINGVPVALIGTGVTTCLGTSTTLNSGSDFVNVI
ncbi:hypothetical protein YDYSY3_04570 [Paenibacillus chitinolyticus]|uniref:hypothetical protein n=1 Tax=Paenibacillus chitinolyticus TaxID=79263 RepID=UPI0026E4EA1D|nr:hypothetical protein [Paenibacillus chitinolyticus]GKS09457.1 hypothetical protein YDYSY3_04570 [Paenibacillus chitinolyticus]